MVPIALSFTMIVAYLTAHRDVVATVFSKPDDFVSAPPFLFLYTSIIVLVFGPGTFSADHVLGLWWKKRKDGAAAPAARTASATT